MKNSSDSGTGNFVRHEQRKPTKAPSRNDSVNASSIEDIRLKANRIRSERQIVDGNNQDQQSESLEVGGSPKEADLPSHYLKSLEDVPLPAFLIVSESVSLLNAAGKEISISVDSVIKVSKRSDHGTLTMDIGGAVFVGNESRLSGKVKLR